MINESFANENPDRENLTEDGTKKRLSVQIETAKKSIQGWEDGGLTNTSISWEDLSVNAMVQSGFCCKKTTTPKTILHNSSGIIEGGKLTAIMGSSGAGKTTMMNILAQRNLGGLQIGGTLRANGQPYDYKIGNVSSYVQQDDIFVGSLTVKEYLTFVVRLRLSKQSRTVQNERIESLIYMMGLSGCKNELIGYPGLNKTISGGEMKRLAVACGMSTNPAIIFLDEPTSGLDSYLAHQVVDLLSQLTKRGTTIICTIHQPSSDIFQMFDNLLLLSKGMKIFNGSLPDAKSFFTAQGLPCQLDFNPADHYIWETSVNIDNPAESMKKIESLSGAFHETEYHKKNMGLIKEATANKVSVDVLDEKYGVASVGMQLKMLMWRASIAKYKDTFFLMLNTSQNIMTALIFGLVYIRYPRLSSVVPYNDDDLYGINGCLFVLIISFHFQYMFGTIFVFPQLKRLYQREYYDKAYGIGAACLSEFIVELPLLITMPLLVVTIVFFMAGVTPSAAVWVNMWGSLFCDISCASGIGYILSSFADSLEVANTLANPIVAPLLLFGGLFIKNSRIPVYFFWLKYLSWFYYAAENMMIGQWVFEDTFYCSLPISVRLDREEAEREVQFAEVAQTFHRSDLQCNVSVIGEECKCYEEYDKQKFNETTVYQRVSGETVLENLAFDKNNLLRNTSKI